MKKITTLTVSAALSLSLLAGCSASTDNASDAIVAAGADTINAAGATESAVVAAISEENAETHDGSDDYVYDEADVAEISLGAAITSDSDAVDVDGTTATITAAGTYRVTGTVVDGQVVVDAGEAAVVQLILDNADITNAAGAAIAVMSAEKAIVIVADGSVNTLADGGTYTLAECRPVQQVRSHHHGRRLADSHRQLQRRHRVQRRAGCRQWQHHRQCGR